MTHVVAVIGQGGFGAVVTATIQKRNLANQLVVLPLNPGTDTVNFVFFFNSGLRKEVLGTITDGPNGVIEYVTVNNDIPLGEKGTKLQLNIIRPVPNSDIITRAVELEIERRY